MIENATRQVQHGSDQKREHQRPSKALIKVWEAPGQTGPHPTLYHGHDKQHHQKNEQAPPRPDPAFLCVPKQICDWAQGELPSTAVRRIAVIQAAEPRALEMLVQLRGSRTDGPGRVVPDDEGSSSAAQARGRTRRRLGYSSLQTRLGAFALSVPNSSECHPSIRSFRLGLQPTGQDTTGRALSLRLRRTPGLRKGEMSRFLFATMPVPGHVAPITPVARTLVERGHDIVWYGSKYHADSIVRSGASFRPIRSTVDYGDDWPVLPVRPRAGDWLFLQPSVEAFEYPRPDLPQLVHFIGPLLPAVPDDFIPPAWWGNVENARAEGTPVVLVTQGTVATDASELIEPTLRALESEDLFVVAAGADGSDLEHIPTNAQVERFVPFTALMPLVDGYVTNGGYGGVTIALANGVPVVSGGTTEDKAEVGQRVAYSGVGINLKTNRPSERKLRDAILTILGELGFRTRAAVIQTDFARHDAPAEAADLLERLADTQQPVLRA
jgi:UDP:flavonoid glycosyltransferase YjiC (YdhE family)